jgi:hypothetical protein
MVLNSLLYAEPNSNKFEQKVSVPVASICASHSKGSGFKSPLRYLTSLLMSLLFSSVPSGVYQDNLLN